MTLGNLGNVAATGVMFGDPMPEHTSPVAGSAATKAGTVTAENPLEVEVGELAVGQEVTITFDVTVDSPIAAGVGEVVNQGVLVADSEIEVLTDDSDAGGDADPTATAITAAPVLVVEKTGVLFDDPGGDGLASPGDELLYRIEARITAR